MERRKKVSKKSSVPKLQDLDVEQRRLALQKQKQCDSIAIHIVKKLIEAPVDEDVFIQCLKYLNQCHFQDIVEERAISKMCGYPICCNTIPEMPKKQYHISTKVNKVYDISDRKNYCSNFCYKAGIFLKDQMLTSPLWFRDKEEIPKFELLAKTERGIPGKEIDQGIIKMDLKHENFTSVNDFTQDSIDELPEEMYNKLSIDCEKVVEEESKDNTINNNNSNNSQNQKEDETFDYPGLYTQSLADILKENAEYFNKKEDKIKFDKTVINNVDKTKPEECLTEKKISDKTESFTNTYKIGFDRTVINTKNKQIKSILSKNKSTKTNNQKRVSFNSKNKVKEIETIEYNLEEEEFKNNIPTSEPTRKYANINLIGTVQERSNIYKYQTVPPKSEIKHNEIKFKKKPTNHENEIKIENEPTNKDDEIEIENESTNQKDEIKIENEPINKKDEIKIKNKTTNKQNEIKIKNNLTNKAVENKIENKSTNEENELKIENKSTNKRNELKIEYKSTNKENENKIENKLTNKENKEERRNRIKNSACYKKASQLSKTKILQKIDNISNQENIKTKLNKCMSEWFTFETCMFIYGEETVKQQISDKIYKQYLNNKKNLELDEFRQKQYEEICKRLNMMEISDRKYDEAVIGKKLRPLPRFEELKKQSESMDLRVQAFYSGCYEVYEEDCESENESVKDEDEAYIVKGAPAVLPMVDSKDVMALRKKIFLSFVSRSMSFICNMLKQSPNSLLSDLKHLINTFEFNANNIVFKTGEWPIVTYLLIKILSIKDENLRDSLSNEELKLYEQSLAKENQLEEKNFKEIVESSNVEILLQNCIKTDTND